MCSEIISKKGTLSMIFCLKLIGLVSFHARYNEEHVLYLNLSGNKHIVKKHKKL